MSWSGLIKVLSGLLLAIAFLVGGGFLAAQYLITQFTTPPPKPTYANDKPSPTAKPAVATKAAVAAIKPSSSPSPSASPSATPSPQPSEAAGYRARVALNEGLNLREEPNRDSPRIDGIDYNDEVIVLEESPDKEWQRVRVEATNQEGWIKAGYTERVN